ncbi:KRI1-like [Achlya hypogyna]|uniref:KRI1-like n=1 Tax=Achlya hypogyna TaxID=1202772 RepID=A0A1V9ZL14_ACHHY|nr:KRI1-like [Achlya hypogyna]
MADKIFEGDVDVELTVNEKFAEKYIERKRKEELSKTRRDDESSDESDSETEDEDGDALTAELDKDISRTLKLIRSKDPSIYDSKISFFEQPSDDDEDDDEDKPKTKKEKKQKPLYYKDLVRQQVLAGNLDSDESDSEEPVTTYAEEQKQLKGAFLQSVADEADEDEDLDGGLFTVRQKSADDEEREAADFKAFQDANPDAADELDADAFLAKYMKSGAWKEKKKMPSYAEIVGDKIDDDEDADELDKADAFEHSYNFRFEEEGGGQIQTFSRTVEDSMRRKDERRKKEREERKARKAVERQKKEDELRRLKNLRQAEIQAKIDKVMALMGPTKAALTVSDVDGAFDPEEHDRRMAQVFNDDYYEEGVDENGKPTWQDDDEVFGKLPEEEEEDEAPEDEPMADDEEAADDDAEEAADADAEEAADVDAANDDEEEMPENLTVEEMKAMKQKYLDELYALDYEDIIGDMPTRFKYKTVPKNDYGLSTMDILDADDKDLKAVVSLKRLAPYADREYSVNRRKVQALRKTLRSKRTKTSKTASKMAPTDVPVEVTTEAPEEVVEDKKKSRKRKRKSKAADVEEEAPAEKPVAEEAEATESKKKRKQKKKKTAKTPETGLSASRLESYRLKPLK